jgi:hypothetical protein
MDALRILSISLLAGCAAAGLVWYAWGFRANMSAYLKHRDEANSAALADSTEAPDEDGEPEV